MRKTILTAAIVVIAASLVPANPYFDAFAGRDREAYFVVDRSVFNSDDPGKVRLEVYYQIYNAALSFYRKGAKYAADYEISVNVYGDKDILIDSYKRTKRVNVKTEIRSKSTTDYRTNQVNFELPPGKYKVKFVLSDPNSDIVLERDFKVKLKRQHEKSPRLSDLQLVQAASVIGNEPTKFDKGGFTLIPSVSHRYGSQDAIKLLFYFEVYQGKSESDSIMIETSLRHAHKGLLYRDSLTSGMTNGVLKQFREISVGELRPGEFRLQIALRGKRGKRVDEKTKHFELIWSESSLLKHDYKAVVGQLSMISLPGDVDKLKEQETYENKLAAFNEFWLVRDPTPGTPENETKIEFYRRVNVANQNFSYLRTNGWKTDRGKVYITYGEPDQVDDYPFSLSQVPYQEWHYYRDARYRKFVFIDETGDGDYRLIYPFDGLGLGPEFDR